MLLAVVDGGDVLAVVNRCAVDDTFDGTISDTQVSSAIVKVTTRKLVGNLEVGGLSPQTPANTESDPTAYEMDRGSCRSRAAAPMTTPRLSALRAA